MKNKFLWIISAVLFASAFFGYSRISAQPQEGSELIKMYLGEVRSISVTSPSRVAVGNPAIADVTSVSKSEVVLTSKGAGTTNLIIWDIYGEQDFQIKVLPEDIKEIKDRVDKLLEQLDLPEIYTNAQEEEDKVIILGRVKTPQERERISVILGPLKDKTVDMIRVEEEETTVDIDVQVLELNEDGTKNLGVQWPGSVAVATDAKADGETWVLDPATAGARADFRNFFKILQWSRTNFYWKVNLLVQEGKARVLSHPKLACQSGKEAELLVGGEKPIMTSTVSGISGGTGTEVEYKEYGIKLKIKPVVTNDYRIKVALKIEISEFSDTAITLGDPNAPTAKAYPLTKRNASTELFLDDGQTLAIGGLIRQKTEEDLRKFPWLADLPVLGLFFRNRETKTGGGQGTRGNSELFITLTPTIVGRSQQKEEKKTASSKKQGKPAVQDYSLDKNLSVDVANYAKIVQQRILSNLAYPQEARSAGFQGTVKLKLMLSYQGKLLNAAVQESSGYRTLDDNAVSTAYNVSAYPPLPPSVKSEQLQIDVPIVYRLD